MSGGSIHRLPDVTMAGLFAGRPALVSRSGRLLEDLSPKREPVIVPARYRPRWVRPIVREMAWPVPVPPGTMCGGIRVRPTEVRYKFGDLRSIVCRITQVMPSEIGHGRRHAEPLKARMILMWLASRFTKYTKPNIGEMLGGRDHSTVCNAVARVNRALAKQKIAVTDDPMQMTRLLWSFEWPKAGPRPGSAQRGGRPARRTGHA